MDDYVIPFWTGILAPAATSRDIVDRLNGEIHKALAAPDLNKRLASNGVETFVSTPQRFAEFIKSETIRFAKLVKDAGIKAE